MMLSRSGQKLALFVLLFLIFTSIHMQFPVLTPLAVGLGATGFMVGLMLGATSFVNLAGNLIAGVVIDRTGPRSFIIVPLGLLAASLGLHCFVSDVSHLFILRLLNGFLLAFLTPACMTMLSTFAENRREQSRNMAVNTLMVTLAMAAAPIAGGKIGEWFGASWTFAAVSAIMVAAFILARYTVQSNLVIRTYRDEPNYRSLVTAKSMPVFIAAFGIMYAQGTLMFELPFLSVETDFSKGDVGMMVSMIGIGTLLSLALFFVHWVSPFIRLFTGVVMMCGSFGWILFSHGGYPSTGSLLLFGAAAGILFPAMMTMLTERIGEEARGRGFALLSAVFSLGTISSPFVAGIIRDFISPYYISWVVLMCVLMVMGTMEQKKTSTAVYGA
ncbi:MFS transporter [Alteribacter natronophilus]|uniref:MFS transporter n=1 Tax=Alteribacter natronophilus TaxID=2583810 RepID=UPI0014874E1D|nr:MFS transporter [Alteribacter natronophilus]